MRRRISAKGKNKCRTGKRRFHDQEEAKSALSRIKGVSTREVQPARVNPCGHCHGWHLTSQPEGKA